MPTIPLIQLASHIEDYLGQTVRACGSPVGRGAGEPVWLLRVPGGGRRHDAGVRVVPCGHSVGGRRGEDCATGRIARRNGSIEAYRDGEARIVTDAVISENWFLYAQCRGGGFASPLERAPG